MDTASFFSSGRAKSPGRESCNCCVRSLIKVSAEPEPLTLRPRPRIHLQPGVDQIQKPDGEQGMPEPWQLFPSRRRVTQPRQIHQGQCWLRFGHGSARGEGSEGFAKFYPKVWCRGGWVCTRAHEDSS